MRAHICMIFFFSRRHARQYMLNGGKADAFRVRQNWLYFLLFFFFRIFNHCEILYERHRLYVTNKRVMQRSPRTSVREKCSRLVICFLVHLYIFLKSYYITWFRKGVIFFLCLSHFWKRRRRILLVLRYRPQALRRSVVRFTVRISLSRIFSPFSFRHTKSSHLLPSWLVMHSSRQVDSVADAFFSCIFVFNFWLWLVVFREFVSTITHTGYSVRPRDGNRSAPVSRSWRRRGEGRKGCFTGPLGMQDDVRSCGTRRNVGSSRNSRVSQKSLVIIRKVPYRIEECNVRRRFRTASVILQSEMFLHCGID